jgi:hypothetical protein
MKLISRSRSLFLNRCWQFGLNTSPEKQAAIARGDTSGAMVHSVFIPICQLFGYLLAGQLDAAGERHSERFAYLPGHWIERETAQRARVLALLDAAVDTDTNPGAPDPLTRVQGYKLLAIYSAQRQNMREFEEFLGNASNIALRHHIALGLDSSIVNPFESHWMIHQTENLKENELNFLRAKSALLLAHSRQLTAEWNRSDPGMYCYALNI